MGGYLPKALPRRIDGIRAYFLPFRLLLYLATGLPLCASAQVQVGSSLDTTDIMIGDQVRLEIVISAPVGTTVEAVDVAAALEKLETIEVLATGKLDTVAQETELLLQQTFLLTSWDTGRYELPAFEVRYQQGADRQSVSTEPLSLTVRQPPVSAEDELRTIKPILRAPTTLMDLLPYLLAILGIIAIIIIILRRRKTPLIPSAPPPPPPSAQEVALARLRELEQNELWQKGAVKEYHTELTYILRDYLEKRFGIKALEATTGEIMSQLRQGRIEPDWHNTLHDIMRTANMVKFAKAVPSAQEHQANLEKVRDFVISTPVPPPTPVESEVDKERMTTKVENNKPD